MLQYIMIRVYNNIDVYERFKVNLIFGPEPLGVGGTRSSSSMADIGGLMANGEGTAAGKPNEALEGPRLNPRFGKFPVAGGGLVADPGVGGAVPLLNSAQRGHFRFVSGIIMSEILIAYRSNNILMCPI